MSPITQAFNTYIFGRFENMKIFSLCKRKKFLYILFLSHTASLSSVKVIVLKPYKTLENSIVSAAVLLIYVRNCVFQGRGGGGDLKTVSAAVSERFL